LWFRYGTTNPKSQTKQNPQQFQTLTTISLPHPSATQSKVSGSLTQAKTPPSTPTTLPAWEDRDPFYTEVKFQSQPSLEKKEKEEETSFPVLLDLDLKENVKRLQTPLEVRHFKRGKGVCFGRG
jgi:hypothetical protein